MTDWKYMAQTGYAFAPPHNPGNYPPMTEIFIIYTTTSGSQKKTDLHGGATSLLFPTDGPFDRFWTFFRATNATPLIYLI